MILKIPGPRPRVTPPAPRAPSQESWVPLGHPPSALSYRETPNARASRGPPPLKPTAPPPARPRRRRQAARGRCGRCYLRALRVALVRPGRQVPARRSSATQARGRHLRGVAAPPIPIPTPILIPAPTPIPILTPRPQFPPLSAASAPDPDRTALRRPLRAKPRAHSACASRASRASARPAADAAAPWGAIGGEPPPGTRSVTLQSQRAAEGLPGPGPHCIRPPSRCCCCTRLLPGPPRNSRAWAVKAPRGPRCTPEPRHHHRRRSSRPRSLQPRRRARNRPQRAAPKVGAA